MYQYRAPHFRIMHGKNFGICMMKSKGDCPVMVQNNPLLNILAVDWRQELETRLVSNRRYKRVRRGYYAVILLGSVIGRILDNWKRLDSRNEHFHFTSDLGGFFGQVGMWGKVLCLKIRLVCLYSKRTGFGKGCELVPRKHY
jgi:hypothetical protein